MTLAKALANGLPVGAMLAKDQIAEAFGPGAHATTFGGTPIVTSAALEVCKIMEDEQLIDQCRNTGAYFKEKLWGLKSRYKFVADVRGMGLLLGMKLTIDGAPIVSECMQKGFLINCIQDSILRFVPPLIIKKEDIDALVDCLDEVLENHK
jgi:acetylornithine aminotransferase